MSDPQAPASERRRHSATWKPGQSGNPGGRRDTKELRELARTYTEDAIRTVAELMLSDSTPPNVRIQAADLLLNRGWGRPVQAIEGPDGESLFTGIQVTLVRPAIPERSLDS